MKKPSKYLNRKVEVDGLKFDSKLEAKRYGELLLLVRAGEIKDLQTQVRVPLVVNGEKVCTYVADFTYWPASDAGSLTVEDVKSDFTRRNPVYRIKRKLFKALYGYDITEV